jgi:hypothetical protein
MSSGLLICWVLRLDRFALECVTSRLRTAVQVRNENCRDAKDESMRIVSQAKTTCIPAEFPVVAVDQVCHGPDQRLLPSTAGNVRRIALERDFVCQPVFIEVAELLNTGIYVEHHRCEIQISDVVRPGSHGHLHTQEESERDYAAQAGTPTVEPKVLWSARPGGAGSAGRSPATPVASDSQPSTEAITGTMK